MKFFLILIISVFFLNSCGIYRPTDARVVSPNADERVKKNIEEGRGFRLMGLGNNNNGNFLFASSNPMWRAALEKLSFTPLNVVDYSGGVIITDWYSDNSESEIKITVRFLSNEIRSDALKIIIHKKNCKSFNNCTISEINNSLNREINLAILKKAAEIEKNDVAQIKEKNGEYRINQN
jgi:hypothetical protein